MARIRSKDTAPELTVRRLVHGLGYRYVANDARLPGSPDLVFVSRRRVIFVHGCFWHSHRCGRGYMPKTNAAWWAAKLARNVDRDREVVTALRAAGWACLVVHECELRAEQRDVLAWRIIAFLEDDAPEPQGGVHAPELDK